MFLRTHLRNIENLSYSLYSRIRSQHYIALRANLLEFCLVSRDTAFEKIICVSAARRNRPAAVDVGIVKLVGSHHDLIVNEAQRLLYDKHAYQQMAREVSSYGDGKAALRTIDTLNQSFG